LLPAEPIRASSGGRSSEETIMSLSQLRWWPVALFAIGSASEASADVHLAMGFRVGEVTQTSAVVWTRVTAAAEPNWQGKPPKVRESPTRVQVENEPIPVAEREGAVLGANGQVRLVLSEKPDLAGARPTAWVSVGEQTDCTHQFPVADLKPATRYHLRVEARATEGKPVVQSALGSFTTPAPAGRWQDVRFVVSSCQMYYHRDLPDGFRIYPAMARLEPHFHAAGGDNVYLDRDNPRAKTVDLCRFHWTRMYGLPQLVRFYGRVPGYWLKDDHDTFFDDCWPQYKAPWIEPLTYAEGVQVYREQVPVGKDFHRTVRWGQGLQVWFVEGRDFRSPNTMTDGPDKTVWGKAQKEWLKKTIAASDAAFRVLVSPTAIVGPDNPNQADGHANRAFAHEGNEFRQWARGQRHFYVCCGDRHWQYLSTDPQTGLREFCCGPASDVHAFKGPGHDPKYHSFYRSKGGFLSVAVTRPEGGVPAVAFRFHDVDGNVLHEYRDTRPDYEAAPGR
jgi:alkaline phosphatase D